MRSPHSFKSIFFAFFLLIIVQGCAARGVYVQDAPPPKKEVSRPPKPNPNSVWVNGHWQWKNGNYVWKSGHWSKPRKGKKYVPAGWKKTPRGWKYVPGRWK